MPILTWTCLVAASYLLGSIPTAYLVARAHGVDIRTVGSGNVGATNVFRSVGKAWGLFAFAADALKGFVPARVFPAVCAAHFGFPGDMETTGLVCAAMAIAGHNWPVWLGFRGGKGVATGAGALMGVAPLAGAVGMVTWLFVFLPSRYVSLASIAAAAGTGAAAWVFHRGGGPVLPAVITILAAVLILRHRSNIKRLLQGTENRITFGKKIV